MLTTQGLRDVEMVSSILPALGELEDMPWHKPVGDWSRDEIIMFAWHIHRLVQVAMLARDVGAVAEREASAKNGGPLMTKDELNDIIPF